MNPSTVMVVWQWTKSGAAPDCINATHVTYHPEGGGEFSLQLSDPTATEATLTGLQCNTSYTITVVATAGEHERMSVARTAFVPLQGTLWPMYQYLIVTENHFSLLDIPTPDEVRAEVTPDNTSIRVSWEWSHQGVLMCVNFVRVHYRLEEDSLMVYPVDNTTATSATLPSLQCNTKYTISVHARGGLNSTRSSFISASLPARGVHFVTC